MRRTYTILALVLVPILLTTACQPKTTVSDSVAAPKPQENRPTATASLAPAEPVTLHVNMGGEPPQVDPGLSTDVVSFMVIEPLFLGLTDYDEKTNEVVPELAQAWRVSEDGLVWTFEMRDDVPWVRYDPTAGETRIVTDANGNPRMVNAHDVEYAVKRSLDPATGSNYAFVLYVIQGAYEVNTGEVADLGTVGVEALDEWTISFTLRQPAGYFPAIASLPVARPVPRWAIEEYGAQWIEAGVIVTNGPYLMDGWAHHDSITFAKNPFYYGADEVQIERVEAVMVGETSTAFAMYENNELDTVSPPFEEMDRIKADPVLSQELTTYAVPCTSYLGFTNNKPPFDNALVRRAFSAAIDRASLVEYVIKGEEIPANTFAPQGIFGSVAGDPSIAPWALDPDLGKRKAQEWLAEVGYPGGAGFPPVTLMCTATEENRAIAEAVQSMWRSTLGVQVAVAIQEWGVYLNTLQTDTPLADMPHIFALGWCADYMDQNNWVHDVFNNQYGNNRLRRGCLDETCTETETLEFDRLTEQAGAEQDPAVRRELYRRAEKILSEDEAAYAPLFFPTETSLAKPWLTRTHSGLGMDHWENWSIDTAAQMAARGK
ncbi:MAG: peptide ABC transporter substrate-binding protein [Anaerolineae bacterium]